MPSATGWAVVGIMLAAIGSLFGALSKVLLKMSHNQQTMIENEEGFKEIICDEADRDGCEKTWRPWLTFAVAMGLIPIASSIDVASFYLAPQSILSPLIGMSVLWNVLLAWKCLGEVPSKSDKWACALILLGCGTAASAFHNSIADDYVYDEIIDRFQNPIYLIYMSIIVTIGFIIIMCTRNCIPLQDCSTGVGSLRESVESVLEKPIQTGIGPVMYGVMAGLIGGQQSVMKAATLLLHPSCGTPWQTSPVPYLICTGSVVTALGGLAILNAGLRKHSALTVVPAFLATMIAVGSASAAAFFSKFSDLQSWWMFMYVAGVLVIVGGVMVLMRQACGGSTDRDNEHCADTNAGPNQARYQKVPDNELSTATGEEYALSQAAGTSCKGNSLSLSNPANVTIKGSGSGDGPSGA